MARTFHLLLGMALAAAQAWAAPVRGGWAKPRPRKPRPPDEEQGHKLWHWIEDNLEIVFPVVGVAVILLILWGVRRGMAASAQQLALRTRQKEDIVRLMRAKLLVNADMIAQELAFDRFHAAALLDELTKEGTLVQARVAGGVASYRLKGL